MTKVALITGASRGIGKTISTTFKEAGYDVIDTYCNTYNEDGVRIDISMPHNIINKITEIIKKYKRIDVLVNNAGISQRKDFLELTPADWDLMLDTNLRGTFMVTQQVLKHMLPRKYGKIINISSIGGITGGVEQISYAASKAAIINFTKSIARLYSKDGIRCNCVSPGIIATDMLPDELHLTNSVPCGRIGTPLDVANVVMFLADDRSDYISGQNIVVDGGKIINGLV